MLAQQQPTAEGETFTILRYPRRSAYFRLSDRGLFLWERLDGERTLRDLTIAYLTAFKSLAPEVVAQIVGDLLSAGFAESRALGQELSAELARLSWWQRAALKARRAVEWQWPLAHPDQLVGAAYRRGAYLLYTPLGLLALSLLAGAGLLAFLLGGGASIRLTAAQVGALLLLYIPVRLGSVVFHEAGHALATKAFGRAVRGAGVGWYWFGPIAFVDTSDMWLAPRWPRVLVSLAGSFHDLVFAGAASLVALLVADPLMAALLWQLAFLSYVGVLLNLNPLLEYDGYYVLADLLDRPNLRLHALRWLGSELRSALREPARLRGHYIDALYGGASLLYVGFMAAALVLLYRLTVQQWFAGLLPESVAAALAWVLAAAVVLAVGANVGNALRAGRRQG